MTHRRFSLSKLPKPLSDGKSAEKNQIQAKRKNEYWQDIPFSAVERNPPFPPKIGEIGLKSNFGSFGSGSKSASTKWDQLQAEYHRRKLALWEKGLPNDRLTQECRAIRAELGLVPEPDSEGQPAALDCPRCGPGEYFTRTNGPHIEARCARCQRHIRFLPKQSFDWDSVGLETETLPFGKKHRGKTFKQIAQEDPGYVRYLAEHGGRKYRALANAAIEEYGL